ncbi:hypothetical protein LJB92_01885 [Bacteroidales bacterium OttesenSCG-928-M06]|nr:hypothetical protein [Bacteroidales bacterium OttesenSCG-928-M06]
MSNLKIKSDENFVAAQELANKSCFNSSVHCSYYGCFQYIKSLLCNNCKLSYDVQNEIRGDSHDYIYNQVSNRISGSYLTRFRHNFENLKAKRKKADYLNEIIDADTCTQAIQEARAVVSVLKSTIGGRNKI